MSYRNDHDAALARVDALQLEVERLKRPQPAEPEREPARSPPTRRGRSRWIVAAILAPAAIAGAGVGYGAIRGETGPSTVRVSTLDARVNRAALEACIDGIRLLPSSMSSVHLSPAELRAVEATAAPCRLEIRDFAREGMWAPTERDALEGWAAAEDTLANTIAMVGVYHGNDPDRLDGLATAGQLWREYAGAYANRDAAIALWRGTR